MSDESDLIGAAERMLAIGEERGLIGAGWRDRAWWRDRENLVSALDAVAGAGGPAVRYDAGAGGGVWIGLHIAKRAPRYFCCSGAGAAAGHTVLSVQQLLGHQRQKRDRWVTWMEGRDALRRDAKRVQLREGALVGGVYRGGAMLAIVTSVDAAGQPATVEVEGVGVPAPAGATWFEWSADTQEAVLQLIEEGRGAFASYMAMVGTVRGRVRKLAPITKP